MGHLGYAVTAHRAQGATVDTAHAVVHSPEVTRESLYVAMTRGRESNRVYVATDEHHLEEHQHREDLQNTARSILYGILQHPGAELSAHDTITVEQDFWGSLEQLAAEYDTIAQVAGQERWIALLHAGGLTAETIDELVETDAFGILTTELRRLEADGHDIDSLLPRIIQVGGLDEVQDLGSLLRYRLQRITAAYQPAPQRTARMIAGLVPRATGITDPAMRQALDEREQLMEQRIDALVEKLLKQPEPWLTGLDETAPAEGEAAARAVIAYRDRWGVTSSSPLGAVPGDDAQRVDYERAQGVLVSLQQTEHSPEEVRSRRSQRRSIS